MSFQQERTPLTWFSVNSETFGSGWTQNHRVQTRSEVWILLVPAQPQTDLRVAVVHEDVARAVVLQVGDLQTARVPDLGRLEGGVQSLHLHHGFGLPGLEEDTGERSEGHQRTGGGGGGSHVLLVEVLQRPLPLSQDELPAEELAVVSAPFP